MVMHSRRVRTLRAQWRRDPRVNKRYRQEQSPHWLAEEEISEVWQAPPSALSIGWWPWRIIATTPDPGAFA